MKESIFETPFISLKNSESKVENNNDTRKLKLQKRTNLDNNKCFSILDDFQSGSSLLNDIFEFPKLISSDENTHLNRDPIKSDLFDFNSYLQRIAVDRVELSPTHPPPIKCSLLNFDSVKKLDLIKDKDKIQNEKLLNDMDYVVRSINFDDNQDRDDVIDIDFGSDFTKTFDHSNTENSIEIDDFSETTPLFDDFHYENIPQTNKTSNIILERKNINKICSSSNSFEFGFIPTSSTHIPPTAPFIFQDPTSYSTSSQRICSPHHETFSSPSKPALKKIKKNLLNFIVESSDGNLDDATRYATEINSQNSMGIPIPEKITELVTIPTTGPDINGIKKAAIVRAVIPRSGKKKVKSTEKERLQHKDKSKLKDPKFTHHLSERRTISNTTVEDKKTKKASIGFYNAAEKSEFLKRRGQIDIDEDKENKRFKAELVKGSLNKAKSWNTTSKKVQWANNLEW